MGTQRLAHAIWSWKIAAFIAIFVIACGGSTATPEPAPTTAALALTNAQASTATPAPINTPAPTATHQPTDTPMPTNTPAALVVIPALTNTPAPTVTPMPEATVIPVAVSGGSFPHVFVGTASIDGSLADDGTEVVALIDGEEAGTAIVRDGKFTMLLVETGGKSYGGKTITFTVGEVPAPETSTWMRGEATSLELNASG